MAGDVLTWLLDAEYQEDQLADLDAMDRLSQLQGVNEERCIWSTEHINY